GAEPFHHLGRDSGAGAQQELPQELSGQAGPGVQSQVPARHHAQAAAPSARGRREDAGQIEERAGSGRDRGAPVGRYAHQEKRMSKSDGERPTPPAAGAGPRKWVWAWRAVGAALATVLLVNLILALRAPGGGQRLQEGAPAPAFSGALARGGRAGLRDYRG